MATESKFFFTGNSEQFTKALAQVKKSMQQVAKQTVALQAGLKLLSSAINAAAKALTTVLGAALKGIVSLVKSALNTVKKLVTGAFTFIKTALSTLLSWIKKALGKIFDWVVGTVRGLLSQLTSFTSSAVNIAKKAVQKILESIQAYADKEYNEIQLKVSLGDSYDTVMKDFKQLLKYTSGDKNDLLTVYSTFAELGKSPADVIKYAKATVYLSNATGRSLSQITRLLLGQEAVSKDLEKTLARIGVSLSDDEQSVKTIDSIISTLDDEMNALAQGSLSQIFTNIKNDVIAIKEKVGEIFSGPVTYIAKRIEALLDKIAGSDKIQGLADKINEAFDKIKPYLDGVFEFIEKVIQDPVGFLNALWSDIQSIWENISNKWQNILNIAGVILGEAIRTLVDSIKSIDWTNVTSVFGQLANALSNFSISVALGAGWVEEQDIVEDSLVKTLMNAWNRVHPDFALSSDDKWYKNLITLLSAAWDLVIKPLWENTIKPEVFDKIVAWWNENWPDIKKTLVGFFTYLADLVGTLIYNLVVDSPIIDLLNKIPGVNIGKPSDVNNYQDTIYKGLEKLGLLDEFGLTDAKQITKSWLDLANTTKIAGNAETNFDAIKTLLAIQNKAGTGFGIPGFSTTGGQFEQEFKDALDQLKNLDNVWEVKALPVLEDYFKTTETVVDDVQTSVDEASSAVTEAADKVIEVTKEMELELERRKSQIDSSRPNLMFSGPKVGNSSILDIPGIPHYGTGGLVGTQGPELAVLGEDGTEFVLSHDMLTGSKASSGTWNWSNPVQSAMDKLHLKPEEVTIYDYKSSALKKWSDATQTSTEEANKKSATYELRIILPWYKYLAKGVSAISKGIGSIFKFFATNGAFGTHIGGIVERIQEASQKEGFTVWTAFGEIIKEFLPYLQKGLEVVGGLFDEAFVILGNAVQILGERIGKMLLPILEAFVPFMKTLADIVVALSPVIESVLAPAIRIIAAILQILTGVLDKLMPVFAALGATIQWISDAISWAIAGVINWLASWIPWVSSVEQKAPKSWGEYRDDIMNTYNAQKANEVGLSTASTSVASQTASYNGSSVIHIHNDFSGAYVVGSDGFRELALIIKNTMSDLEYSGQTV